MGFMIILIVMIFFKTIFNTNEPIGQKILWTFICWMHINVTQDVHNEKKHVLIAQMKPFELGKCDTVNMVSRGPNDANIILNGVKKIFNPIPQVANKEVAESRTKSMSYGVRHLFIVIQWTMSLSSLNHDENMPYLVWKCLPYGIQ